MENQNNRDRLVAGATRVLAVVGFMAVIVIGLWGSVSVARAVPGAFSSLAAAIVSLTSVFVPANETITLSAPTSAVQSGEAFVLSWTHNRKNTEGTYTFRFQCADGVSFVSPTQSGASTEVSCNTPFNFLNANNSIVLTPFSKKNTFTDVTVAVEYTPNGAAAPTVTGSTVITIENNGVSGTGSPVVVPSTTTRTAGPETSTIDLLPTGNGTTASDPNGQADLAVKLIEVGLVDKDTGEFTASSTPSRSIVGKRVAARFAIENVGTRTSGQWTFNAVLPTFPSHIYSSPTQQALGPGDRIEYTIGFDRFEEDNEGVLTINVDPTGSLNERNKTNNIGHYTITVAP